MFAKRHNGVGFIALLLITWTKKPKQFLNVVLKSLKMNNDENITQHDYWYYRQKLRLFLGLGN
jgi:hypothetical protein